MSNLFAINTVGTLQKNIKERQEDPTRTDQVLTWDDPLIEYRWVEYVLAESLKRYVIII